MELCRVLCCMQLSAATFLGQPKLQISRQSHTTARMSKTIQTAGRVWRGLSSCQRSRLFCSFSILCAIDVKLAAATNLACMII